MSLIKDYAATIAETDDGVADFDAINEMQLEMAWKEYDYNKLKEELNK